MTTNLSEDDSSEGHTGATFRNTENVNIYGGHFSMTSTTAEQTTHMESGWQPRAHNGNSHRSSRYHDRSQWRPYSRNTRPTTSTNSQQAIFSNSDTVQAYDGFPQEGTVTSRPQNNTVHAGLGITRAERNLSTGPGRLVRPSNAETNNLSSVRAPYDIYYHQLLVAGRGSPMWIPGPDMKLSTKYRKKGTTIGDVGILYCSEGFYFLFNIFLRANNPINKGRVPPGFEPLKLPNRNLGLKNPPPVYGPMSYVTSTSMGTPSNMDSSLIFSTSAAEGAVLVMPDGAISEDQMCHKFIKMYIAKNAKSWYEYFSEVCGLEVNNGDIRLVMGFDKVSSWGIATSACSVGEQARLEFKNVGDISQTYMWRCVGSGSGRVGPCDREMQGTPLRNQSVFIRTLNFDLSGKCWNDLINHRIRSSDSDSSPPSHCGDSRPGGPGAGGWGGGGSGGGGSHPSGGGGSGGGGSYPSGGGSHSTSGGVSFYVTQSGLSVIHPSSSINKILLDKHPKAQIAITEDADWIAVITQDDVEIPKADELCTRLLATRELSEEDGIITFRSEDFTHSEDTPSPNFASQIHISNSDVTMVGPSNPLHPTEKAKGTSASEVILPAIPLAGPWQLPAQSSTASLPTSTTDKPTTPVHQELSDYPSQSSSLPCLNESSPPSFSTPTPDASTSHNPPAPNTASVSTKGPVYKDTVATYKIRHASLARRKAAAKFTCSFEGCSADFTRKHNLECHIKSHLGIRDSKCEFCDRGFTSLASRKRHQRRCPKTPNSVDSPSAVPLFPFVTISSS